VLEIESLELHVAHACNLSCESCSHYSNHEHRGLVSLEQATTWMKSWSGRVRPRHFRLLGGEPTVHPDLAGFIEVSRSHWPDSQLWLVTNGFFLHRHPTLPAVLEATGTRLCVSIHDDSSEYQARLAPVRRLISMWLERFDFGFQYRDSFKNWTRRYKGYGSKMQPFNDGRPRESWAHCRAKRCTQLFDGALWKCAPLAYLGMQHAKYDLPSSWRPYLAYEPLDAGCSDAELSAFVSEEEHACCAMCPAKPERFSWSEPPLKLNRKKRI